MKYRVIPFRIRGFAGGNHSNGALVGSLLLETTHKTESSAYMEIMAWKARMARGEVSHVELIDCREGGKLTNLHVYQETEIPWSWKVSK